MESVVKVSITLVYPRSDVLAKRREDLLAKLVELSSTTIASPKAFRTTVGMKMY